MKAEPRNLRACAGFADRLVDLSDGELPASERQLVESHVATCSDCRAELVRLDTSLAALRAGVRKASLKPVRRGSRNMSPVHYAAGAVSLALLLAAGWSAFRLLAPSSPRETARITKEARDPIPPEIRSDVTETTDAPTFDEAAILRQIALLEQQARLQASIDLMPRDPWFAEQRAANEELLATFKNGTTVSEAPPKGSGSQSGNLKPSAGETL